MKIDWARMPEAAGWSRLGGKSILAIAPLAAALCH